jgi:hypothetical protein
MRPLPTVDYPDKTDGVTLKCSRIQETVSREKCLAQTSPILGTIQACYRDPLGPPRAYGALGNIVKRLPVHMIYGAIDDYM